MEENELRERLVRVEMKLDTVIPHIEKVSGIERDISILKKVLGVLGSGITLLGTWVATYLGYKNHH